MAWRARDQVAPDGLVGPAGDPEQLAALATLPPTGERRFTAVLPPGTAARVPEEARKRRPRDRGPAAAGRVGGPGRRQDRHGAARLVPRSGDRPPVRARTGTPSASITARRSRSATSSRSGRSPGCSTSRCWPRPGSSPMTSSTPAGSPTSSLLVAGESVPVRDPLDERHRARHPADQPGLDPASAGRLARRRPTCSSATALALRQIRWHQQYLAAFRSRGSSANNHVIAEAAGQLVASCAFPWFARERPVAAHVRAPAGARAPPQHLPVRHQP